MTEDFGSRAVSRRGFFAVSAGAAAATATAASGSASTLETDQDDELPGTGDTVEVTVGPDGDLVFDPDDLELLAGTTVRFVWDSNSHNIAVQSGPEDGWQGYDEIENEGFEYEHTFEVEGEYEYICEPHEAQGMAGSVAIVAEDAADQPNGEDDGTGENGNGEDDEQNGDEADDDDVDDGLPGAGETEEVIVGPGGDLVYDPEELFVLPGTTVNFVWDSDNHNLNVQSGPDDGWDGYDPLEDAGFEYEHTFEVEGEYEYVCDPHVASGMEAEIIVTEDIPDDDGQQQRGPTAPEVPSAAMSLAIGTIAAMASTLTLAYFFMKYGSANEE